VGEALGRRGIHDKHTSYTWSNAFAVKIATLNTSSFAGYSDWRLPNVKELLSIVSYQHTGPAVAPAFNTGCAPGCTVVTCSCTEANTYWSSTTFAGNPIVGWSVGFDQGYLTGAGGGKASAIWVRAVRGES
jgi:hypothetical protein